MRPNPFPSERAGVRLDDALLQIREIRGQLAHTGVFRGTRALTIASTALVAVVTAFLQPRLVEQPVLEPRAYLLVWLSAAALATAVIGGQVLVTYFRCTNSHERATTRTAFALVMPALAAGALVTLALGVRGSVALLPGLWPLFVGLSLFSTRHLLPKATGIVALGYVLAGSAILLARPGAPALEPWVMGSTFSLGQLALAGVLYWNLERDVVVEAA